MPDQPDQAATIAADRLLVSPGTMIGRYRVQKRLGAGAMGDVYIGLDESLGRRAAIKVLGARHLGSETVNERFLREARALASLSHPNVIAVFEAGQFGDPARPYFAMELLEGGDTHKLLGERGTLPSGTVALIGAHAAAGLAAAAHAGIIHRDVKPSNLGISAHGVLKVTDFGLAKSSAAEKSLTGRGITVGTADYIAPEQARGEPVDERADVYSLGCTLFHLLAGHPPFRADEGTPVQTYVNVMRAHLNEPVPDAREFAAGVDEELAAIVERMMAKDRDQRPTLEDVAPQLGRVAARLHGELPRLTRRPFTLPTGVTPEPVLIGPPSSLPEPIRRRWPMIVALVAVATAVVMMLALLVGE